MKRDLVIEKLLKIINEEREEEKNPLVCEFTEDKENMWIGVYYSHYPYEAKDFKVCKDPKNPRSDALDMPFRLYKAATCMPEKSMTLQNFLHAMWEGLDEAEHTIDDIHTPFTIEGINVIPTEHLYGATNERDGIYIVAGKHYVRDYGEWLLFPTWEEAFDYVYYNSRHSEYLKGIDYKPCEQ